MDDVWGPAQFSDCFQNAASEKNRALIIACDQFVLVVKSRDFFLKVLLVVDKVHLDAGRGYRGHLDYQRVVRVVDIEVHPAEANHLVELVATLIDDAEAWHEHANFTAFLVYSLRQVAGCARQITIRKKGFDGL